MKFGKSFFIDLILNVAIPFAVYNLAKHFGANDFSALILAGLYPLFDTLWEFKNDRSLNFISSLVLFGTIVSIIILFFKADTKLLLIRESFFTGGLGIACFISLFFHRPLMFYAGRELEAGKDPVKRKEFEEKIHNPKFRFVVQLITLVWGVAYTGEFLIRVGLVMLAPIQVVLLISPIILTGITVVTTLWTFWYIKQKKARAANLK